MKKVFLVIPSLASGGAEHFFANLAHALSSHAKISIVLLTEKESTIPLAPSVELIRISASRSIKALYPLYKIICKNRPDVIISTLVQANFVVSLVIPFFPKILFVARETLIASEEYLTKRKRIIIGLISKFFYPLFDKIIFQSNFMQVDHFKTFNSHFNSTVINNFVNRPDHLEKVDLSRSKALKIFTVCRLDEVKQIGHMLEAVSIAVKKRELSFAIIGDGPQLGKLKKLSSKLGLESVVSFLGYQTDPTKIIKKMDVFLMASKYEGFPNALLEGLAAGKPVISYDSPGGIGEIVISRKYGVLVPANSISGLSEAIIHFSVDQYNKTFIQEETLKRFSKEVIVKKYCDLFNL